MSKDPRSAHAKMVHDFYNTDCTSIRNQVWINTSSSVNPDDIRLLHLEKTHP